MLIQAQRTRSQARRARGWPDIDPIERRARRVDVAPDAYARARLQNDAVPAYDRSLERHHVLQSQARAGSEPEAPRECQVGAALLRSLAGYPDLAAGGGPHLN